MKKNSLFLCVVVLWCIWGCSSSQEKVEEGNKNPVLPLSVMQWKHQFAHESVEKAYSQLGEQEAPLLPNSSVLVLAGCKKMGVEKVEHEFLKGFVKYLEDNTKGRILVGCWDERNKAQKLNQAAGFQPYWDQEKCDSYDAVDENRKTWTLPFILKAPDSECGLPKVDEVVLVSNQNSLGKLGPIEMLSGVVAPGQKHHLKTVQDFLQLKQMMPPIRFVSIVDDERAFALAKDILPIDLLHRQLDEKGTFIWFHPVVKSLAKWEGWDISKPLIQMILADELGPENYAKYQVAQVALENPVRYRGVPLQKPGKEESLKDPILGK